MSIFLTETDRVIVQGMTGSEGRKHTTRMLSAGTKVVAGVNPRKAGTTVAFDVAPIGPGAGEVQAGTVEVPVYGTVAEAKEATAERDGMELIAVILGAPTSSDRFEGAKALLNYGFAAYALVPVAPSEPLTPVPVTLGTAASVQPGLAQERQLLLPKGEAGKVTTTVDLPSALSAPVEAGQELGHLTVLVDGQAVEEIPLVAQEAVGKRSLWQVYGGLLAALFCGAGEAGF